MPKTWPTLRSTISEEKINIVMQIEENIKIFLKFQILILCDFMQYFGKKTRL